MREVILNLNTKIDGGGKTSAARSLVHKPRCSVGCSMRDPSMSSHVLPLMDSPHNLFRWGVNRDRFQPSLTLFHAQRFGLILSLTRVRESLEKSEPLWLYNNHPVWLHTWPSSLSSSGREFATMLALVVFCLWSSFSLLSGTLEPNWVWVFFYTPLLWVYEDFLVCAQ